jgi:hypothetical protein
MGPLRRLLFGSGRLPDDLRAELTGEGLVVLDEGLTGSITLRHYRAPGQRSAWKRHAVSGAIAVTGRRLVVWAGRGKNIDVPLDGALRSAVEVTSERPDRICFAYDAGRFNPSRSGRIEVRLRTTQAPQILHALG